MRAPDYKVIPGDAVSAKTPVAKGQILKHRGGLLVLRCPRCGTLGLSTARVSGPDHMPTLSEEVRCGCLACNARYRISGGKVGFVEESQDGRLREHEHQAHR